MPSLCHRVSMAAAMWPARIWANWVLHPPVRKRWMHWPKQRTPLTFGADGSCRIVTANCSMLSWLRRCQVLGDHFRNSQVPNVFPMCFDFVFLVLFHRKRRLLSVQRLGGNHERWCAERTGCIRNIDQHQLCVPNQCRVDLHHTIGSFAELLFGREAAIQN